MLGIKNQWLSTEQPSSSHSKTQVNCYRHVKIVLIVNRFYKLNSRHIGKLKLWEYLSHLNKK